MTKDHQSHPVGVWSQVDRQRVRNQGVRMRENNKTGRRAAARTNGRPASFDAGRQRPQQAIQQERAAVTRKPQSAPLELRADEDSCVREMTAGHAIVEVLKAEGVRAV